MAKTWQNILDEARVILQDTNDVNRFSDEILLAKLNRGVQELARLRPDAFWDLFSEEDVLVPQIVDTDTTPDTDPEEVDEDEDAEIALTDNFNIHMMFYSPLVYWVAGSVDLIDDEFSNDGRAITLITQFKAMVVSL